MAEPMLTQSQRVAFERIEEFLMGTLQCFVLQGYAGTGKTYLVERLVRRLEAQRRPFRLLAPTGRAAKVLAQRTGCPASTIHRAIYSMDDIVEVSDTAPEQFELAAMGGDVSQNQAAVFCYSLRPNDEPFDTVYVIDESSMVSDVHSEGEFFRFGSGRLLKDLLGYVGLKNPGIRRKIVFVGDPAQLPPVGASQSPALSKMLLRDDHDLVAGEAVLRDVVRQTEDSAILSVATQLREALERHAYRVLPVVPNGTDVLSAEHAELGDLVSAMRRVTGGSGIAVVTHTNAAAGRLNAIVRQRLLPGATALVSGDRLLVTQNSYLYGLLNGELVDVVDAGPAVEQREVRFRQGEELRAERLEFRDVALKPIDSLQTEIIHCKILETFLNGNHGELSSEQQRALYIDFKKRHKGLRPGSQEYKETLRTDPYFHALRVKFGYAMTCHKAQGGEWDTVFVDFEGRRATGDPNVLRWAYTAVTRARAKLYVLGLPTPAGPEAPRAPEGPTVDDPTPRPTSVGEPEVEAWIRSQLAEHSVSVEAVSDLPYRRRFIVSRGAQRASFDYTYNSKGVVRGPEIHRSSGEAEFLSLIADALKGIQKHRHAPADEGLTGAPFERVVGMDFLSDVFKAVEGELRRVGITVKRVEHQEWRERYHLVKSGERAVVDLTYDGRQGITGVQSQRALSSSLELLDEAIEILETTYGGPTCLPT